MNLVRLQSPWSMTYRIRVNLFSISELGAKIEVLSEKDSSNWVVRKFNSDDTFTINKRMIEITKMNWKRNKSPEPNINPKNKAEKKKNRMATIWKEPDKSKNTYRQSRLGSKLNMLRMIPLVSIWNHYKVT